MANITAMPKTRIEEIDIVKEVCRDKWSFDALCQKAEVDKSETYDKLLAGDTFTARALFNIIPLNDKLNALYSLADKLNNVRKNRGQREEMQRVSCR